MEGERNVRIDVLWRQFQQNKTKELRDRIIEHYLPLVNVIAGRLAISLPSHVDKDDLVSSGFFGLMDAVSRYDYARGNKLVGIDGHFILFYKSSPSTNFSHTRCSR